MLRAIGIHLVIYMDDMLLMASSKQSLMGYVHLLLFLLENLGFIINSKNSILCPSQEIEFLGVMLNSMTMEIRLPGEKIKKMRQEAHHLLSLDQPSAQLVIGQAECNYSSPQNGSPILLLTSNVSKASSIRQSAELSVSGPAISSSTGRSPVVETPPHLLEWETPTLLMTITSDASQLHPAIG